MSQLLGQSINNNIEEQDVQSFKEIIYKTALYNPNSKESSRMYKNKWFNSECLKARRVAFKFLNLFRIKNTEVARKYYLDANKNYKELCREARRVYYKTLGQRLTQTRDSKEWWAIVRELKQVSFVCGNDISMNDFANHFEQLLNPGIKIGPTHYAEPQIDDRILDGPIVLEEIETVLAKSKNGKAPGLDRIPVEFYKNSTLDFQRKLASKFNNLFQAGVVPDSFKNVIIFPLFKRGDINDPANYRGLSFEDSDCKLFTGILLHRLNKWVDENKKLKECQAGFRRNYSTVDSIFNLCSIIHLQWELGKKKVYGFFVDFKAAFDSIDRSALFYKLLNMGVSNKFVNTLKALYTGTKATVWNGQNLSQSFTTNMGVRQGDIPSPTLFTLYLNDLEDALEEGIKVADITVSLLMYADDIVILADDSSKLQRMISRLETYCDRWNLTVNLAKSKIMVFRKGGRLSNQEKWYYEGDLIEVVSNYKYLGIELVPSLSFQKHLKERLALAKNSINITWNQFVMRSDIGLTDKYSIFEAVMRAITCYGAQVWGYKEHEDVEKVLRYFIKRLLRLPSTTPTQ